MAFTGRATYDTDGTNTIFKGIGEDVSPIVGMISPYETPLLDFLGDPGYEAKNIYHEWLEESLGPNTLVSSFTVDDNDTALGVHSGGVAVGVYLMVGTVLKNNTTGEYLQVSAAAGSTISFTRAFGGSTAATITVADVLAVVSTAALEGADVDSDISRPRTRQGNYCQIFARSLIVSGTELAVSHIGVGDELAHQKQNRTREVLLDLERQCIIGKSSTNTIGSASARRTFKGLWDSITTNSTSLGTINATYLEDAIQKAWDAGGTDVDCVIADKTFKRAIDSFNTSRIHVLNNDSTYRNKVTYYEGTFGVVPIMLNRWMPKKSLMVISRQRVKVLPLQGRSFQYYDVAKTGDASKGQILGEYVLEVKNEAGMSKSF